MEGLYRFWQRRVVAVLDPAGDWFALLPIRLLMAWEFCSAGMMKLRGENWFVDVQDNFPFPFNVIPVGVSWHLATWTEILGSVSLAIGLFTRFWALSLIVVTIVAISGVHWPMHWSTLRELWMGYAVRDRGFGNFRIPLLFIAMLLPLAFKGAGKLSVDYWLSRLCSRAACSAIGMRLANLGRKRAVGDHRVRDQARILCLLQHLARTLLVGALRNVQSYADIKVREAGHVVDAIQVADDVALKIVPVELRGTCHGTE